MSDESQFTLELTQLEGYRFEVRFDVPEMPPLVTDEPVPLGGGTGPNPSRLIAAAAANCLSASLLFCLAKENPPGSAIKTQVTCQLVRNDKKRLRIGAMKVRLAVNESLAQSVRMARCQTLFEDFCVATASLRDGIPVTVEVVDPLGTLLHQSG
ncbi:MAG: OsmC family protein [Pseudomonadota bacterium]